MDQTYYAETAVSPSTTDRANLAARMCELETIIHETSEVVRSLEDRLNPILFIEPVTESKVAGHPAQRDAGFPAGSTVANLTDNVTVIRDRLLSLHKRLAL